jgi:hypothetical protein
MWLPIHLAGLASQKVAMPLIANLDHMGVALFYVGTTREETQMLIQSSLLDRVRVAQQ